MSSSLWREPLSGTIRQDTRVIGAICLPEDDVQDFIDQFNHCYGPLRMRIEPPSFMPLPRTALFPVGAARRRPLPSPQTPPTAPPSRSAPPSPPPPFDQRSGQ
ncbi:MAG: hypothetical protein KDA45_05510 [Planctomycetales bacterium]|nr:hypothetical protein [Planctomycetales bacterium]